jgi:hypothetical protein
MQCGTQVNVIQKRCVLGEQLPKLLNRRGALDDCSQMAGAVGLYAPGHSQNTLAAHVTLKRFCFLKWTEERQGAVFLLSSVQ